MPRRSWPALVLLIAFAPVLRAQSTHASLNGRVADSVNAVIVNANVAAINLDTDARYETTTNVRGEYFLTNLPRGVYQIEIDKSGFNKLIKSSVSLDRPDTTEMDFELTPGLMSDEPHPSTASEESANGQASLSRRVSFSHFGH